MTKPATAPDTDSGAATGRGEIDPASYKQDGSRIINRQQPHQEVVQEVVYDNSLDMRPPDRQHIAAMALARQISIEDAPGAHRIAGPGVRTITNSEAADHEEDVGGAFLPNLNLGVGAFHAFPMTSSMLYSNVGHLPPNIDIIAEATLVEQDEEEGANDNNDSRHSQAACERSSNHPGDPPEGNAAGVKGGGGDNEQSVIQAEKLDNMSIYICGRYFRFKPWHGFLLAAMLLAIIAVPIIVTKNNNGDPPPIDWTRELIESIVSPSVSDPAFLTILPESPQSLAVEWLTTGGADIITGPSVASVEWRVRQRYVLAVLYYSTNGPEWKNQYGYLNNEQHECDWAGGGMLNNGWKSTDCVEVEEDRREVTLINLWQNNLRGTIPRELGSLNLTAIDFLTNKLEGTVPEEIYAMKDLNYLNFGYNKLTGTVASELGSLDKLTYLMLDNNDLTGTIPPELGNLTQLYGWLSLEGNQLTGTVPSSFAQLTNAAWIYLNYNKLTGSAEFMCEALRPTEAPGGVYANESSALSELWVDVGEVECSCCNCCPFVEEDEEGGV